MYIAKVGVDEAAHLTDGRTYTEVSVSSIDCCDVEKIMEEPRINKHKHHDIPREIPRVRYVTYNYERRSVEAAVSVAEIPVIMAPAQCG